MLGSLCGREKNHDDVEVENKVLAAGVQEPDQDDNHDDDDDIDMNEILPGLFLGDKEAAIRLIETNGGKEGIRNILNVADRMFYSPFPPPPRPPQDSNGQSEEEEMNLEQIEMDDFGRTELDLDLFKDCFDFIDKCLHTNNSGKGGKVLVHCHLGVNRSATIVIAYLMRSKKYNFEQAMSYVQSKRDCIGPNTLYVQQLKENVDVIHGIPSVPNGVVLGVQNQQTLTE